MLKAVFMDVDNTILSFDDCVRETMKRGFARFDLGVYTEEMFSVFERINGEFWGSIEKGELSMEELKQRRWNRVFAELGITFDGVEFERYFREILFDSALLVKGATEALSYLHGKYIVCAATNGPGAQQRNRLIRSNTIGFFDHIFISEEIGASKPSSAFFDACFSRLEKERGTVLRPGETVIIGDSLRSDIFGGAAYGIKTCWYNPKKAKLPEGCTVDHVIASLDEIQKLF